MILQKALLSHWNFGKRSFPNPAKSNIEKLYPLRGKILHSKFTQLSQSFPPKTGCLEETLMLIWPSLGVNWLHVGEVVNEWCVKGDARARCWGRKESLKQSCKQWETKKHSKFLYFYHVTWYWAMMYKLSSQNRHLNNTLIPRGNDVVLKEGSNFWVCGQNSLQFDHLN